MTASRFICATCGASAELPPGGDALGFWPLFRWHLGAYREHAPGSGHCPSTAEAAAANPEAVREASAALATLLPVAR